MRKLIVLIALLFSSLFVAQATMAATARYSDCCMDDCQGMAHCVAVSCQVCAAPAALPATLALPVANKACTALHPKSELLPPAPLAKIWNPPD